MKMREKWPLKRPLGTTEQIRRIPTIGSTTLLEAIDLILRRIISDMAKEMYCPYCQRQVKSGIVNWGWFIVFLFLSPGIIYYLLFCLFYPARICKECKRRIYEVRP